ncbi:MAG: hypothetical protein ACKVJQ_11915 [Alphaproteobacteria bacterium]|jgi:hypothetical protein
MIHWLTAKYLNVVAGLIRIWSGACALPKRFGKPAAFVKLCAWLIATVWIVGATLHTGTNSVSDDYVYKARVLQCKSHKDRRPRFDCISSFTIMWQNRKFHRLLVIFLPPFFLIPVARITTHWLVRRG